MEQEILTKIPEGERPIMEVVWENIEMYRVERGMNIAQLCHKVGYAASNYYIRIKDGGGVAPSTLQKFAWALDVKTLDLFEDWSE